MCSKVLFLITIMCFASNYSNAQRENKFFRKDYIYLDTTKSFYKAHNVRSTWPDAKRTCDLEGATLFYPENGKEARAVVTFWQETQPFEWAFIGISDLVAKGIFETIDGLPVWDVYHYWAPGEPYDAFGQKDCVALNKYGALNAERCFNKLPFICKKSLDSVQWNQACKMPYLDYMFNQQLGRCYTFHLQPKSWIDAYAVCNAEQSYLAVINTQLEADYLVSLTANAPKDNVTGDFLRETVHLGFHNRTGEGWQTVKGKTLEDSGYARWGWGQPDGAARGVDESCGSMFDDGQLNDIQCDIKSFFICEHEVR